MKICRSGQNKKQTEIGTRKRLEKITDFASKYEGFLSDISPSFAKTVLMLWISFFALPGLLCRSVWMGIDNKMVRIEVIGKSFFFVLSSPAIRLIGPHENILVN